MKTIDRNSIQLIVYDFDGVLTDNRVLVSENGEESVFCNRSDGLYIGYIRKHGLKQIILSTEKNSVVSKRAEKINLPVFQGISNKWEELLKLLNEWNISAKNVIYVGNDMNDWECLKNVGHPMCPQDSHPKLLQNFTVIPANGGAGIVRHLYDLIYEGR